MNSNIIAIAIVAILLGTTIVPVVDTGNVHFDSISENKSIIPINKNGNTLYVGGSGPNNYTKIQDAINDASDGDIVYVYPGLYKEHFSIRKSISLIGHEKNSTIVEGYFTIYSDFVNISNFSIKTRGSTWAIQIFANNTSIYNNNIELYNYAYFGIRIYDSLPEPGAFYNKIMKNSIYNFAKYNRFSVGIQIWHSAYNHVSRNLIVNFSKGVYLNREFNDAISDNTLIGSGIFIEYYGDYRNKWFDSHTIKNNTLDGKPIYYLNNPENFSINGDASEIIIVNTSNFKIENREFQIVLIISSSNFRITRNSIGHIVIIKSDEALIDNNTVYEVLHYKTGNTITIVNNNLSRRAFIYGKNNTIINNNIATIDVGCSSNMMERNTIKYLNIVDGDFNIFQHNKIKRISILYSSHNIIRWNEISNADDGAGVNLHSGSFNEIYYNNITNCRLGVYVVIPDSISNNIMYNNFINNTIDAKLDGWCYLWDFLYSIKSLVIKSNHWDRNYWQDRHILIPKVICGTYTIYISRSIELFSVPWVNFDWHPAKGPYEWWSQ